MHLSICNLNIPIWHQAMEGGEFDRLYTTSEGKMLSDLADKILRSWPNGWPKMGCRNSGTHFNASMMFLYPILIWKRPTGTSILFWNNLAQLNGKIKCPTHVPRTAFWNWGTAICPAKSKYSNAQGGRGVLRLQIGALVSLASSVITTYLKTCYLQILIINCSSPHLNEMNKNWTFLSQCWPYWFYLPVPELN